MIYTQPNCLADDTEDLQTWNNVTLNICQIISDVNSGTWFPHPQTQWNVIHNIQVKLTVADL